MTFKNTVPYVRNAKTASACDVGNKAPKTYPQRSIIIYLGTITC